MSTVGVCHVCGTAEASQTCETCGALVCDRHYDEKTGFCQHCLRGQS